MIQFFISNTAGKQRRGLSRIHTGISRLQQMKDESSYKTDGTA